MSIYDWLIMLVALVGIIIYGVYKGRGQSGAETYFRAGRQMPWHVVLLGIMATQASAITFLSGPGQAYTDGMRFVQYYFGLPLAMIVIAAFFVPIFRKLQVYTAYEFLDQRFDRRTRLFTGILFLFSRGVSTGISVYAPAIILSSILDINIYLTNILVGGFLIIYTYTGGAKAIAHTQKIQFTIILISMAVAGFMIVYAMPKGISFDDALFLAGKAGKLNVITTDFGIRDKYNLWSGIIGGFFLALSYFGTDQSQVGRYLTAKDNRESRLGLLMNGFVKIPMQFLILLMGALLFSFYSINKAPLSFNDKALEETAKAAPIEYQSLYIQNQMTAENVARLSTNVLGLRGTANPNSLQRNLEELEGANKAVEAQRAELRNLMQDKKVAVETNDTNYIFLHFVRNHLPVGMIGLLFAVVFLASWGSISAALNALSSSTLLDFHNLVFKTPQSDAQQLRLARLYTLLWGIFSILVAMFATKMGSLIEAVNELGSLFYGAILGIFLVAFFIKHVRGKAVFAAALLAELLVLFVYYLDVVGFLWLNVIGAGAVVIFSLILQSFFFKASEIK